MEPVFFAKPRAWRSWLEKHHATHTELLVGFYKTGSGRPSMSWPESVDAALSFGWIDGVRRRIDDVAYSIRFTPRRSGSIWSVVNIRRVGELTEQGLMHAAGLKAFAARTEKRSGIYAFEQSGVAFEPEHERLFRANRTAWRFFSAQAPWYRRTATWWVVSAKREDTRTRRLSQLIDESAGAKRLDRFTPPAAQRSRSTPEPP